MTPKTVQWAGWLVLIGMGLAASVQPASAQSAVGTGPLTTTLSDTEPTSGVLTWGPVKVAPGVVVRELGYDSNVFDEATNPKEDYLTTTTPDVSMFSRTRFFQVSAYGGLELTYFQKYTSERSIGHAYRGRVDFLLSRVRPFIAGGETQTRTRANGELDTRANRKETEYSGGLAFDFYAHSLVYAAAYVFQTDFENALERGVDLETSLDREGLEYSAGIKTDLTPLASLTVSAGYGEDRFRQNPLRNATSRRGTAAFKMGTEAVVSGVIMASYQDFRPVDPGAKPYRGVTGSVALAYPFLEIGRLSFQGTRGIQYSFDVAEAYFVENTVSLTYTHLLFGAVDAQVKGGTSLFDYGFSETLPAHKDTLDQVLGGFGYNLKNRTRVSVNYEYSRRRSPALAARNYDRRRLYLAWTFGF